MCLHTGASQVVQKEPLIFNNTRLEVKLMTPPKYMPVVPGPFEENLVLVSGLSPMCTDEDLKAFFTAQDTHSAIQHVTFSLKQGIAMLQFTHPPGNHLISIGVCQIAPSVGAYVRRCPIETVIFLQLTI